METSSLNYSNTVLDSIPFPTLNFDDLKGNDESLQGPSWHDFLTPNRSIASFYNSISLIASPTSPSRLIKALGQAKESMSHFKSILTEGPLHLNEAASIAPADSNEFLRKKTMKCRESLAKSAKSIVDFALTGKSEVGLPDEVNLGLVIEVFKKAQKETNKKITVDQLMRFIKIIQDDDMQGTPKTGIQSEMVEFKSKQSHSEVSNLNKALETCKLQIKAFQEVINESMGIIIDINNKWAAEKTECNQLKERLSKPNEELEILKKALIESERLLDIEKKKKKEGLNQTTQTEERLTKAAVDEKSVNKLLEENNQLKLQLKQNLDTLDKLFESVSRTKGLETSLFQKEKELESTKKDKQELIEAVEQLVDSAQRILESSKGSKQQKLRLFAEMMGSLKSISLSDLQH